MVLKRSLIFMLLVSFALVSPAMAKQRGKAPQAPAEVKALMEKHNLALNAHDLKGVMDTYSNHPNVVLMGTGPGEVYVGDDAIGGAYSQFFSRFEPKTLSFKTELLAFGLRGNLAWFAVTTTLEGMVNQEKRERSFNMSGTVEKVKGKWRIVSLHFSRLGAEQQAGADKPK